MKRRTLMALPGILVATTLTMAACVSLRAPLPAGPVPVGASIAIKAAPVPLDPSDPKRSALGDFVFAGGVSLTSDETSRLHGLSDLVVETDGDMMSVTDDGADLFTAKLVLDAAGRLVGLSDGAIRPLTGLDGAPLQGKAWSDAEGVTRLANGEVLVSFERNHRIWGYPMAKGARPAPAAMPTVAMAENDGMEGLAAASTISPEAYWVGVEPGGIWFCRLRGACGEVNGLPRPPLGYRLSSLNTGLSGELVILHHSYVPAIGSRIIVTVVKDPLGAKRVIGSFSMAPPLNVENYEGVAVVPRPGGGWRLYLLADDNFSPGQRTLMLAFDWTAPK